jgi:hypothetical protein
VSQPGSLPDLPGGLSPRWLTELLRAEGVLSADALVTGVDMQPVGDGTGMMAELSRLVVTYEGDAGAAPKHVIAKYASRNAVNRDIALRYQLPERETRFALELAPRTTARTPMVYFAGMDGDRFLILMEDLSDYAVGSQARGATLEQSERALDELARLHSAFWDNVDDLSWVPGIADSYHAQNMQALAVTGVDGIAEKFADVLAPEIVNGRQRLLDAIPAMQQWMMAAPVTLVHGDYRMENLLYGCRPDHHPVVVIDWQGPLLARGMTDVALFLAQSTRTSVRRAHERALLARYVERLAACGVHGYQLDQAWDDYRHAVMYSWVYVVVVAGTLDVGNATAYRWMREMVARQTATSHDLAVFDLLP